MQQLMARLCQLWQCSKSAAIRGTPVVTPTSLRRQSVTQSRRVSHGRCYELSRLLQALVNRLTQYDRLLLRNKSSSQLVVHEFCNAGNCSLRFRHHAHAHVPNMPHVRPYLDLDVTAGGAHFVSYSYSVVAQHFITADEN